MYFLSEAGNSVVKTTNDHVPPPFLRKPMVLSPVFLSGLKTLNLEKMMLPLIWAYKSQKLAHAINIFFILKNENFQVKKKRYFSYFLLKT